MPKSTRLLQRNRSLPEIAMDCHMAITGASDPIDTHQSDIKLLEQAITDWEHDGASPFDNAVLQLIQAVVTESASRPTHCFDNYFIYTVTGTIQSAAVIVGPDGFQKEIVQWGTDEFAIAAIALNTIPKGLVAHVFTDNLEIVNNQDNLNYSTPEPLTDALFRHCATYWYKNEQAGTPSPLVRAHALANAAPASAPSSFMVYCDGACPDNGKLTARSGVGVVIQDQDGNTVASLSEPCLPPHTNQRAELQAAIAALRWFEAPSNVTIYSDSQYLVNTITKGWSRNTNHDLWKKLDVLLDMHNSVKFHWVKGHSGHPIQSQADNLAVQAASQVRPSQAA